MRLCIDRTLELLIISVLALPVVMGGLGDQSLALAQDLPNILQGSITRHQWYEGKPAEGPGWSPQNKSVRLGDKLTEDYKLDAAKAQYRQALRDNPKDAGAYNGLGKVHYRKTTSSNQNIRQAHQQLIDRAIQEFMTALRLQPRYTEAHLNLARVYLDQGRVEEAKPHLAQAMTLAPESSDANMLVGRVLLKEGNINTAISFLKKATLIRSENSAAHYHLGVAYSKRAQYDEALRELQTSIYQFRNSAPVYLQMGKVYERQGNGAAAVNAYKQALEIKPELAEAALKLSSHYERRGDLALALEQLKNTYEALPNWHDPDFRELSLRIGELSLENRQPGVAIDYYKRLLRFLPQDSDVSKRLSEAQLMQVQMDQMMAMSYGGDLLTEAKAKHRLEQSLVYNPANIKAKMVQIKLNGGNRDLSTLEPAVMQEAMSAPIYLANQGITQGEVYTARFDYRRANESFEAAMRAVSEPADVVMVGEMLLEMGQPDLAIRTFKRVPAGEVLTSEAAKLGLQKAREARRDSQSKVLAAKLFRKKSNWSEARRLLNEAIALDRRNAEAHELLGELLADQKYYRQAIRHYHVYLTLNPSSKEAERTRKKILRLTKKLPEA